MTAEHRFITIILHNKYFMRLYFNWYLFQLRVVQKCPRTRVVDYFGRPIHCWCTMSGYFTSSNSGLGN